MPKVRPKKKSSNLVEGNILQYNAGVQNKYVKELNRIVDYVIEETEKEIRKIGRVDAVEEITGMDESAASQARIMLNALTKVIEKKLGPWAKRAATAMMNNTNKASASMLHNSVSKIAGKSIKTNINTSDIDEITKATISDNVDLIKSISSRYLDQVKGSVFRSIQKGGSGVKDLQPEVQRLLNNQARIAKNRAKNIALDQTRKAYTAVNTARMESLGINKFEWIHSGGGKEPRALHVSYNGKIFDMDNPPIIDPKTGERGLPGQAINCKCTMRPVVQFDTGE